MFVFSQFQKALSLVKAQIHTSSYYPTNIVSVINPNDNVTLEENVVLVSKSNSTICFICGGPKYSRQECLAYNVI